MPLRDDPALTESVDHLAGQFGARQPGPPAGVAVGVEDQEAGRTRRDLPATVPVDRGTGQGLPRGGERAGDRLDGPAQEDL